ncbi:glycosyltransferase [Romboutsia sp. 1001713B170207_170306_H8]|uniref:glycosyltransferase n=1 Tax=Romboutsia sp. 1001713B170207_170306_H8 TaxID=2787112 RepID=UPI0018977D0B|nr:glycosyltransferase [Romboutsia sp. 1001713B170207_170306_H8]
MISLSLCMIVRDEEDVIKRCLNSVAGVVDEIIIVDTGSIDKTKEIAMDFTDKIFDFKWNDDFSEARNFSFSKSSKDYILWLDADEYFDKENKNKLKTLKESLSDDIDVVTLETNMLKKNNNCISFIGRRNRIVKRIKNFRWIGFVHEYIDVEGEVFDSDISIIHNKLKTVTDRNLILYEKNIESGNTLSDRDLYYYGKELYCNKYYEKAISILEEFIKKCIWVEELVDSLRKIGKCYLYLNDHEKARTYFYKCFEYISPNIGVLYDIAESFEIQKEYRKAISWYEIILKLENSSEFNLCECECIGCIDFNVNLSLCVCNFEIGNINKSYYHHLKCKEIDPQNACVTKNDEIFNNMKA